MVIVPDDFALFHDVIIIVIVLVNNIVFVYNIMLVFYAMLMLDNLPVPAAVKVLPENRSAVVRLAATRFAAISLYIVEFVIITHNILSPYRLMFILYRT